MFGVRPMFRAQLIAIRDCRQRQAKKSKNWTLSFLAVSVTNVSPLLPDELKLTSPT